MSYSKSDFIKVIHATKAVSIWNHATGPVFWYAASVPGPFYVNTEFVIGADLSAQLLEQVSALLAETPDAKTRAEKVEALIMGAYDTHPSFQKIIETLAEKTKAEFPSSYALLSGGERRDWLFSIPLAKLMGIRHLYIFKNLDVYCAEGFKKGEKALHVSDLINNAASYFDRWFPALEKAGLPCIGTISINSRGANGLNRLKEVGQKVVTLNSIDIGFFEDSEKQGIIDTATLEELRVYFRSSQEWAATYLVNDLSHLPLFQIDKLDAKSLERLKSFFTNDPWKLEADHQPFFAEMKKAGN